MVEEKKVEKKCVIYARVSDKSKDESLDLQIEKCKQYAYSQDFEIENIYSDLESGASELYGRKVVRKGFEALKFDLLNSKSGKIVVIRDIDRVARDVGLGNEFIELVIATKSKCFSPKTGEIDLQSLLGRTMANMQFLFADFERRMIRERIENGIRNKLEQGIYPFSQVPRGYKRENGRLVRQEPQATYLQHVFESIANGSIESQVEALLYLRSKGIDIDPKRFSAAIRQRDSVKIYAGIFDYPKFNVYKEDMIEFPIISKKTYEKLMYKLNSENNHGYMVNKQSDFTFRRLVACDKCEKPFYACYSRSRNGVKHGYYFCRNKGCVNKGINIPKAKLEDGLINLISLSAFKIDKDYTEKMKAVFDLYYEQKVNELKHEQSLIKSEISQLKSKSNSITELLYTTKKETLRERYEQDLEDIEKKIKQKELQLVKLASRNLNRDRDNYWESVEHLAENFSNQLKKFNEGDYEGKRQIVKDTFEVPLLYDPNSGFRTANYTIKYAQIRGFYSNKNIGAQEGVIFEHLKQFILFLENEFTEAKIV